jgi:hypothetical protein
MKIQFTQNYQKARQWLMDLEEATAGERIEDLDAAIARAEEVEQPTPPRLWSRSGPHL